MRISSQFCLVFLLAVGVSAKAADERIDVGPLHLDVYVSRTATLFHVVDQLSEWSYYCHRQYGRAFAPLSDADRAMLETHKAVREKHPWGAGLEQTFYSPLPLEEALKRGVAQGWLSPDEAAAERNVLLHFAPRIDALLTAQESTLAAFRERLRHELADRSQVIEEFARFTGKAPDVVPAYVLPNPDPHNMGGGYNGGRLTIEIPTASDAVPTALHELFHAFLELRRSDIKSAVAGVHGLDAETLNEGLAYAFSPGIVHREPADDDPLSRSVGEDFAAGKPLSDAFTRFNRYALALRPLLKEALADERQTLSTFLPRAVDVWRALYAVDTARDAAVTQAAELRTVTIIGLYGRTAEDLPAFVREGNDRLPNPTPYFVACKEWVTGTYRQMSAFYSRAGHEILFTAPGLPDVRGHINGHTVSSGDGSFQAYGLEIVAEDRGKVVPGASYSVKPINTSGTYRWQISDHFVPVKLRE
jgi:hypothetical protein